MGKYTQINAFWLYGNVMRYRTQSQSTFRGYVPVADTEYTKLSEEQKRLWKDRAIDLRQSVIGQEFRQADKTLKKNGKADWLVHREAAIKKLVANCSDMML